MAVNEKTVYANGHVSFGRKIFRPGEEMSGRVPDYVLQSAQESGAAVDSHAAAERAKGAEAARREDVARQIEARSEKRDYSPREDRR